MASVGVFWVFSKGTAVINQNVTTYFDCAQAHPGPSTAESALQSPTRVAGIFSNFSLRVPTNNLSTTATITFRIAGADGNQAISVGANGTGDYVSVGSDTVDGSGQLISVKVVAPAGSGAITITCGGLYFVASSDNATLLGSLYSGAAISPGTTVFAGLSGLGGNSSTESREQFDIRTAGTLRYLWMLVGTNSLSTATTTVRIRKNAGNGNSVVSISAGATGTFEDLSNTDSVAANDLVNYSITLANGGTGSLTVSNFGCVFITTNGKYHFICGSSGGTSFNAGTTNYWSPAGGFAISTGEDNVKILATIAMVLSNLEANVISNTIAASSTLRTRKNSGNGNQSASIPSSTTGYFEDTGNTDTYTGTDYVAYQLVAGGSGGSTIRLGMPGTLVTPVVSDAPPKGRMRRQFMPLLGM